MRIFFNWCMVIAICLGAGGGSANGQDFGQLLDAVDKLEESLKILVVQESQQRDSQIAKLQKQLDAIKKSGTSSNGLEQSNTGLTESQVMEILSDIEFLKAEVKYARDLMNKNRTQLASLDGDALFVYDDSQYERLTQKIAEMSGRLDIASGNEGNNTSKLDEESVLSSAGITLSGFVDASNYADFNSSENSFSLDQVEVDITKDFSGQTSLRADIEYVSDGVGGFNMELEQGYLTYTLGSGQEWSFMFGKFNAPIGFELLDAPDMFQFSHALVFNLGLPTNLTGIMVSTEFPAVVDFSIYIVNGWDVNSDNNKDKTFGTRLGLTPTENLNFGFSLISGPEIDDNNSSRRTVFDWDLTYNPLAFWTVGWEFNYGVETKALVDGTKGTWNGLLLMNNFALGSRFGLTGRFDYFKDSDGLRTGTPQTLTAFAISPSISIADGLAGLFELRYDKSTEMVFTDADGNPKDNSITMALEFTYGF